ncbi:helix-turn-helix domain-containing protein [Kitasatospora aureofaciens]|uniref:helix-turn-helix domain-containing protein n=1 Tax=Kitasatospora aureofaciens TaxID=1894 RepID=UPI00382431D0
MTSNAKLDSSLTRVEAMSVNAVLALPAMVPVWPVGAAAIGGISRPSAYKLAKTGTFPVTVISIQGKYYCRRSDLLAFLGIAEIGSGAGVAAPTPPNTETPISTSAN